MKTNSTAHNIKHLCFLLACCTLLSAAPIGAQSAENAAKIENDASVSGKQILRWNDSRPEFTKCYAVEIQRFDPQTQRFAEVLLDDGTGARVPIVRTDGRENEIVVSPQLAPGKYRYRITKFDLLGRAAAPSAWSDFEIEEVFFVPEITGVFPPVVYIDEFTDGFVALSGKNLFLPGKESNPRRKFVYTIEDENGVAKQLVPDEDKTLAGAEENGSQIVFFVDPSVFALGTFYFSAEDFRGLKTPKTDDAKIEFRYKKRIDFNVSLGYAPPYIVYDDTFDEYVGGRLYPLGAAARFTLIPVKRRHANFGVSFAASYTRMNAERDTYSVEGNVICAHVQAVYQLPFRRTVAAADADGTAKTRFRQFFVLEFRAGAGMTFFCNYLLRFPHDIQTEPFGSLNISAAAGVSAQLYLTNRLYAEIGADFIHAFVSDMQFGTIIPSVSIGWQF
ncbi:MAG: hypothetical protein NC041_08535 [Bacteroides sp.]|nr:hypothetical protein [Prevotella sp.]MCM1408270.1 hypothetical protein [Treponema brennaborense]MCM1470498.1 hypothetical protein [Bacteroides sp.]